MLSEEWNELWDITHFITHKISVQITEKLLDFGFVFSNTNIKIIFETVSSISFLKAFNLPENLRFGI